MKKLLLASAVAALSISAQAAPQVYGKAFLTLDLQDGNNVAKEAGLDTRTQLNSNASRIGFKGAEALTANTDLIYQLEYRVEVDDDTRTFEARDSFLGLANKQYGTLLAGRLTAIDGMVDYANVTVGGVVGGDNVLASFDAPRANNAFAYVSPSYNGLNFLGMYVLDEKNDVTADYAAGRVTNNGTDSLGRDAWGVGAQYEPNGAAYRAGATYIQAGNFKATRVSGAYDLTDATTIGALYQNTKFGKNSDRENAFTVSAEHKLVQTPWTAYGQLDFVDNVKGVKDAETFRVAAGGKYAFNKATTGHIYGAYKTDEVKDSPTAKTYGVGAGIEYKF